MLKKHHSPAAILVQSLGFALEIHMDIQTKEQTEERRASRLIPIYLSTLFLTTVKYHCISFVRETTAKKKKKKKPYCNASVAIRDSLSPKCLIHYFQRKLFQSEANTFVCWCNNRASLLKNFYI